MEARRGETPDEGRRLDAQRDSLTWRSRDAPWTFVIVKTHLEAAYAARDLMDFSLQGRSTAIRMLAMMLPFFNAPAQGLYKLGRDGIAPTTLTLIDSKRDGMQHFPVRVRGRGTRLQPLRREVLMLVDSPRL